MELRPYQKDAVNNVLAEWDSGHKRTLVVMATGLGKTVTFAALTAHEVAEGKRVLILAHRGELLDQAADKLRSLTGLKCAVEKADQTALGEFYRVTVGSVQSMQRASRLERFADDYYQVIIIDEAHHALSDGYRAVLDHFSSAQVLGVTATPDRGDMRSLGQVFESCAYEYGIDKGVRDGYLCPIKAQTIPLKIDISDVKTQNGDFAVGELGTALEPYLEGIADEMEGRCKDRKTVVFLPLIKTSQKFCEILCNHGFRAAEVNGNSPDREEILQDFADGKYNVLCNSMLLTEGWDCPSVDCIIVLRPTKVRALYTQMVGRGLRLHDGKKDCLLLDFLWNTERHALIHPAHLLAKNQEIAEQAVKIMEEKAGGDEQIDIVDLMGEAESDVVRQREESLARELDAMRKRKAKLVDPLQYIYSIDVGDLATYEPTLPSEMAPPTKKQLELLEKRGINPDDITCSGQAAKIIDALFTRQQMGLSTPKQIRFLERKGFRKVGEWEFSEAKEMIDLIAWNNWQVPFDIIPYAFVPKSIEERNRRNATA